MRVKRDTEAGDQADALAYATQMHARPTQPEMTAALERRTLNMRTRWPYHASRLVRLWAIVELYPVGSAKRAAWVAHAVAVAKDESTAHLVRAARSEYEASVRNAWREEIEA